MTALSPKSVMRVQNVTMASDPFETRVQTADNTVNSS